ncbi:MAG: DUF465 domain-containing protein [Pseudomonadota bacterium]|jgi:uncharacterized protein YdcH (DUF465 family)
MSHTPHELHEEFPADAAKITELKVSDSHFAKLVDDYHDVNRAVHRAETLIEPVAPEHEAELRRRRLHLKDQIAHMLHA